MESSKFTIATGAAPAFPHGMVSTYLYPLGQHLSILLDESVLCSSARVPVPASSKEALTWFSTRGNQEEAGNSVHLGLSLYTLMIS